MTSMTDFIARITCLSDSDYGNPSGKWGLEIDHRRSILCLKQINFTDMDDLVQQYVYWFMRY